MNDDAIEDLEIRVSKIEGCIESSDNFDEFKECLKPLSKEEFTKAISRSAKK